MNFIEFRNSLAPFPVFSIREIEKYFPVFDSRRLVEWQQKGYINRLRNRYYCFSDQPVTDDFLLFTSNRIYTPSYVSLEWALSFYNFIPEGVFQTTSCTTLKTEAFDTPIGRFSYRHLKPELFFGYRLRPWNDCHILIAEPEKAVMDYLYLNPDVRSVRSIESLRWNQSVLSERLSLKKLNMYEGLFDSRALSFRLTLLKEYMNVSTQ